MSARKSAVRLLDMAEGAAENKNFFATIVTTQQLQVVYGHLMPSEKVDEEIHHYSTQVITVATGTLKVTFEGHKRMLMKGDTIVIAAGILHELESVDGQHTTFWTIYSPPVHKPSEVRSKKGKKEEEDSEKTQE